ncbi:MAG: type II toxin-antitoxin system RelE/ParE family toxin [Eggerthellaceae bacterium]|nr:type II toxin-antitoxin system RelE/ParE family toxin [Eggerthellaceae bacterium]
MWRVVLSKKARKQLNKLNPNQSRVILAWLKKNIDGCENPRALGKALTGDLSDQWRYRIGDYRVLCEIHDGELIVLALNVIHRSKAYQKKS